MSAYNPPLKDMQFLLFDVLGFTHPEIDRDTASAILEEASKLASDVLAPLNMIGDQQGARLEKGQVYTAKGFKEAYAAYREGGWNAVPFDPQYGGQGLPYALAFPIQEMWQSANMSFGLCPLLNQGAVEAILAHGTQAQKDFYLPKLITGEWTGTMNLTEAHAGSDLGLLRTKAERVGDGTYKISGQKIFITYGDHDMADNIIHLVLARIPDAPEDVKGISLFIVPKILENGARNRVMCIGLEHKLGIHASPTCTMDFDGATGYLVGAEHQGLKYMFTMMNNARLCVGLQGVAIAERAYQHALAYAQERMQGKSLSSGTRVMINQHPDVKRMLMTMRAHILAGRALAYRAAVALDAAEHGGEEVKSVVDLLTPIVKAYCTDMAVEVASLGVQVHGGMGFIEETGAAQYYRDARILPIYEGTNGIQAADLVFRKVLRDDGAAAYAFMAEISSCSAGADLQLLKDVTAHLVALKNAKNMDEIAWLAMPYLKGFSLISGAAMLLRMQKSGSDADLAEVSVFYQRNILPFARAYLASISN
jgi:alkylation response protein AidB-like acyl-CoA dehydrogenase